MVEVCLLAGGVELTLYGVELALRYFVSDWVRLAVFLLLLFGVTAILGAPQRYWDAFDACVERVRKHKAHRENEARKAKRWEEFLEAIDFEGDEYEGDDR